MKNRISHTVPGTAKVGQNHLGYQAPSDRASSRAVRRRWRREGSEIGAEASLTRP